MRSSRETGGRRHAERCAERPDPSWPRAPRGDPGEQACPRVRRAGAVAFLRAQRAFPQPRTPTPSRGGKGGMKTGSFCHMGSRDRAATPQPATRLGSGWRLCMRPPGSPGRQLQPSHGPCGLRPALPAGGRRVPCPAAAPASRSAGTAPPSGSGPQRTPARLAAPRTPSRPPPQPRGRDCAGAAAARLGLLQLRRRGSHKGRGADGHAPLRRRQTVLRTRALLSTPRGWAMPRLCGGTTAGHVTHTCPCALPTLLLRKARRRHRRWSERPRSGLRLECVTGTLLEALPARLGHSGFCRSLHLRAAVERHLAALVARLC